MKYFCRENGRNEGRARGQITLSVILFEAMSVQRAGGQ
jgi:hypothetical protein